MDEQDFKRKLHEYVKLNDTIAAISKKLSDARKTKANMTTDLLNYMKYNAIDEVHVDTLGGKVIVYDSKRTEALKRHHIESEIMPLVENDATVCARIVDRIYASRNVTREPNLSRRKR